MCLCPAPSCCSRACVLRAQWIPTPPPPSQMQDSEGSGAARKQRRRRAFRRAAGDFRCNTNDRCFSIGLGFVGRSSSSRGPDDAKALLLQMSLSPCSFRYIMKQYLSSNACSVHSICFTGARQAVMAAPPPFPFIRTGAGILRRMSRATRQRRGHTRSRSNARCSMRQHRRPHPARAPKRQAQHTGTTRKRQKPKAQPRPPVHVLREFHDACRLRHARQTAL